MTLNDLNVAYSMRFQASSARLYTVMSSLPKSMFGLNITLITSVFEGGY
jgi:hypothetical protein